MFERKDTPEAFDKVFDLVAAKGINGQKAYMQCVAKSPKELEIRLSDVLTEQEWVSQTCQSELVR